MVSGQDLRREIVMYRQLSARSADGERARAFEWMARALIIAHCEQTGCMPKLPKPWNRSAIH